MEARLLGTVLGVVLVQVETAMQSLDLPKVELLFLAFRRLGAEGSRVQLLQSPVSPASS